MNRILITVFLGFFLLACGKEKIREIDGNQAPEDQAVTDLEKASFVNKLYISLTGKKAGQQELEQALVILGKEAAKDSRAEVVDQILGNADYKLYFQDRYRLDLVEGVDSAKVSRDYFIYQQMMQDTSIDPNFKEVLQSELQRLSGLININVDFLNDQLDYPGVHRVLVDNPYYDQINMGTENFVVNMFQHFLDRYPSGQELADGKQMVDGLNGTLFLQTGIGKADFLTIFFNSDAYKEGLVHRLYERHLFRKATQDEVLAMIELYNAGGYESMHRELLISKEYFEQ